MLIMSSEISCLYKIFDEIKLCEKLTQDFPCTGENLFKPNYLSF